MLLYDHSFRVQQSIVHLSTRGPNLHGGTKWDHAALCDFPVPWSCLVRPCRLGPCCPLFAQCTNHIYFRVTSVVS